MHDLWVVEHRLYLNTYFKKVGSRVSTPPQYGLDDIQLGESPIANIPDGPWV